METSNEKKKEVMNGLGAALLSLTTYHSRGRVFLCFWPRGISRFLYFVGIRARRIEQFRDIISWKRKRI